MYDVKHKSLRQYSDQMHCSYCGKQWDVNDPDPPECDTREEHGLKKCLELRNIIRRSGK